DGPGPGSTPWPGAAGRRTVRQDPDRARFAHAPPRPRRPGPGRRRRGAGRHPVGAPPPPAGGGAGLARHALGAHRHVPARRHPLRFTTPVRPGDEIHVVFTCKEKAPRRGAGYGEVRWDTQVVNQDGTVVATYDVLTMVATKEGGEQ